MASPTLEQIQLIQSDYRRRLAEEWQIPSGARVLEIGCGQGDMTAVLAEAVGPAGHVIAVDLADPSYGAPMTLAQATDIIKASEVGARVEFRFNFDVLDPASSFLDNEFDYVVLAHCSWYFANAEQLGKTFATIRPWAKRFCFAEWDMEPRSFPQMAHLLAVLIQGQVEAFKATSESNVRTPLFRTQVKALLEEAGWNSTSESVMDTHDLQDADWEVRACLSSSLNEVRELGLPDKFVALIESQVSLLQGVSTRYGNLPLSAYSIVSERN